VRHTMDRKKVRATAAPAKNHVSSKHRSASTRKTDPPYRYSKPGFPPIAKLARHMNLDNFRKPGKKNRFAALWIPHE